MSGIDHIFLYCTMLMLAYIYDRQCRTTNHLINDRSTSTLTLFLLGIVFVITEGFRYGRGVDQCGNYGPFYQHCMNPQAWYQDFESLFVWINQTVYKVDPFRDVWPFGAIFIVYALIFFVCLYLYYKDKKKETKCFLFIAILATNYITEWTIRQGVSFSFILLGLHYLEQGRWKWMLCAMFIAFSIHHGNVLAIILPVIFYYFLNKKPIPWKITVPLFVVLEYTMQVSFFQNVIRSVSSYLDLSSLGGNFSSYVQDNALEHEAESAADWNRGALTQLLTVLFYSSLILIGAETCKVKNKLVYIYNAFVIGIMIYEPFRLAGSIARMFNVLSCLWFVPLSYSLYNFKKVNSLCKWSKWAFFFVAVYILSYYGRYILMNPEANYIWNL